MDTNERGRPVLDFKQRSVGRSKVRNFQSWSVAFSWYMRAVGFYHPHLLSDLVQYQGIIGRFATQYAPRAWLNYDRAFRRRVAMVPSTPWHAVDEEIFSIFLRGAPAASRLTNAAHQLTVQSSQTERCFNCRGYGHRAYQCASPVQSSYSSSQTRAAASAPSHVLPRRPFVAFPRSSVVSGRQSSAQHSYCFAFNDGHCPKGEQQCPYKHVCGKCAGAGHVSSACTQIRRSDSS